MNNEFCDKTFVIIGATSGIGAAVANSLSQEGANSVLIARNSDRLELVAKKLNSNAFTRVLDVSFDSWEKDLIKTLEEARNFLNVDSFDGGVYCPGIAPLLPLRGLQSVQIEEVLRINYVGAVMFTKVLASKEFRHNNTTSIVLISSVTAEKGEKGLGVYGASKAALEASTKSFARELAPFGVRINCVSPGWLNTEMNKTNNQITGEIEETMRKLHPLGTGSAEYVSDAILYLLSDKSCWITGTSMIVDGGFLA